MFWEHNRMDKFGKGGTIINTASVYAIRSEPISPRSGVRVVAICPGLTETNLVKNYSLFDDTISDYVTEFMTVQLWQKVDSVGRAAIEIFEKAESGTAWLIEGGLSRKHHLYPYRFNNFSNITQLSNPIGHVRGFLSERAAPGYRIPALIETIGTDFNFNLGR
ncbi:unnamed protein product [Leptidea sinapis]|uniref:Uncharacterized protein n=1 Tax=Leptidea sinapis TaxID=189913 RepID=A0A5E4PKW8_9NEOP|nr:unnamed protein product [Leptidea sinapis]